MKGNVVFYRIYIIKLIFQLATISVHCGWCVSSPTSSSTLLFTPLFTATSSTISLTMAFASGSPNAHIFESTIAKLSLFLSHTSCTSLMTRLLCSFINSTFSGVSKSSFSLISFRFVETFLFSALCEFPLFGGVMATDDVDYE